MISARTTALALLISVLGALLSGCFTNGQLVTQQIVEDAQRRRERNSVPTPTIPPTVPPLTATPSPTRTPFPGRSFANVVRVWDGNTVLIQGGYTVRYIGIDTPGAGMFNRPLQPFGREAAERNVELVEGQQVELEADTVEIDPSGFLLRYVYVEGEMVNAQLLSEGLAKLAPSGRNVLHQAELLQAEAQARVDPVNVWTLMSPTPTITATPTETIQPTATPYPTPPRQPTVPLASRVVQVARPPTATYSPTARLAPSFTPTATRTATPLAQPIR